MDSLPDELLPYVMSLEERRSLHRRSRAQGLRERIVMALGLDHLLMEDKISYLRACLGNGNDAAFFIAIQGRMDDTGEELKRYTYEGTLGALNNVFLERFLEIGPKQYREDFTDNYTVDLERLKYSFEDLLDPDENKLPIILDFVLLPAEDVVLEEHQVILGYWDEYQVAYQAELYQGLIEEDPLLFEQELQRHILAELDQDYQDGSEHWIETNCIALGLSVEDTSFDENHERLRELLSEMMS